MKCFPCFSTVLIIMNWLTRHFLGELYAVIAGMKCLNQSRIAFTIYKSLLVTLQCQMLKIKMQSAFFNDCFPIWNHCLSLALHIVCQGREALSIFG